MSAFKLAIIGAGPGGCMLARLLHQCNISATIFEGDVSLNFCSQGGTLDLHDTSGIAGIKEAGLYDEFAKYARFDGDALTLCDKNLVKYLHSGASTTNVPSKWSRPEIDRADLRQLLANSQLEGTIRFDHRLQAIDEDGTPHFANGVVERGYDLVIGADGAWSKVRRLLSEQKLFYSRVRGYSFPIPRAKERAPEIYKLVDRGSLFAFSDSKSSTAQQIGDGSIMVAARSVRVEDWMKESKHGVRGIAAIQKALREEYSDWKAELLNLTQSLYMLPTDFRWTNRAGVTLLGDAAHLMTPVGGTGVNLALEDAMKLSRAIVTAARRNGRGVEMLHAQVAEYEEDMFKRVRPLAELTHAAMGDMLFTEGAPSTVIEGYMLRLVGFRMNRFLDPLFATTVHTYFFCFKLFN